MINKFFFTVKVGQNQIGPINVNPSLGNPEVAQPSFAFNGVSGGFTLKANGEHGATVINTEPGTKKPVYVALQFISGDGDVSKNWTQELTLTAHYGKKCTFRSANNN